MNKKEFAKELARKTNLTTDKGMECITAFTEIIEEQLKKGNRIQFVGFGTFETIQRSERTGRNPQTGKEMIIKACTVPKFAAGKQLKDAVK
ncbi:HU family DNA-binding protein [Hespellia stercorisuis]|uniref:DNA-binding protein HU-beta n=1 Tax=Hespellia stercorisuis DSM 15480 TaxID=1121950 RepID=A0A1M6XAA7_9FIRM|nr:HU family DNA-binding protein [Hespellia stercorisuis]SHL02920.1 DNA-binding protein HU-beta [Hespellia stercorisuis DSM 15480]